MRDSADSEHPWRELQREVRDKWGELASSDGIDRADLVEQQIEDCLSQWRERAGEAHWGGASRGEP